jgi:hypothetical protein
VVKKTKKMMDKAKAKERKKLMVKVSVMARVVAKTLPIKLSTKSN